MTNPYLFDPMSDLIVAQFSRPADLGQIDLTALSPFQRSLLAIDGTVTKFIEAYTLEPVNVIKIGQQMESASASSKWLELAADLTVIHREVLLQGKQSQILYAYAISLIARDRLQSIVKESLEIDGLGLGQILLSSKIETYREVLWYGRETPKDLPENIRHLEGKEFISRTYRIIAGGQPIMLINEKFPFNHQ